MLQIATRDSVLVIDLKGLGERDREEDEGNGKEGTSGKGGGAMMRELNDALSLVMPRTSTFLVLCHPAMPGVPCDCPFIRLLVHGAS